ERGDQERALRLLLGESLKVGSKQREIGRRSPDMPDKHRYEADQGKEDRRFLHDVTEADAIGHMV
ncbi:MAG: hypothetical protein KDD96_17585, partial [Rhodobacteraceae bacterium]|nr:hypothetical protein [Paracoccaceae bacterium]